MILRVTEGWSFWDGLLRAAGNVVLIPLTSQAPASAGGKALDVASSVLGVGLFGFVVALIGALPYTDECADRLGGKLSTMASSFRLSRTRSSMEPFLHTSLCV